VRDELKVDIHLTRSGQDTLAKPLRQNLQKAVWSKNRVNIITSFLIYLLTFSTVYLINEKHFYLNAEYFKVLGYFIFSLVLGASFSQKFNLEKSDKYVQTFKDLYLSSFISLLSLIIILPLAKIHLKTREYVVSAVFVGLIIESFYFILLNKNLKSKTRLGEQLKLAAEFIILDGLILSFFLYLEVITNIFPGKFSEQEFLLLVVVYLSWVISAAATHKFVPTLVSTGRMNAFEIQVKFYFRIISLVVLAMIILQLDSASATGFIKALVGYSFFSSLLFIILFAERIKNKNDEATVVFLKAFERKDTVNDSNVRNGKYSYYNSKLINSAATAKLQFEYLKEYGEVFSVLDTILDLKSFDTDRTLIMNSDNPKEISLSSVDSYQLIANLHVLNDQQNLNDYLLDVRKRLVKGGVFVGALLPHHYRYRRYLNEHSFYTANILYFFDFIWKRVMPKLPVTREIYTTFSKEKDRAISLAEGLGRLVYCGFNIINLAAVDNVVYFAAVREGVPYTENKFFYSPIFKMNRIGKNGTEIKVYKLRTMYPYAEYLQDYIVKLNGYSKIGKPANDFRLPVWGKLFRKYWIDEIPQLLNVFKGEMKLVGARPLSKKVYNDYPADLKEIRNKYKPGCIPPYVSLLMQSMEKSIEAERIYLNEKEIHPVLTDFKYFFNALNNILSRKIRSS
jgi:lipopolysaccharide/colanic/teichoic acid biosynthesis glycosyltransferase